MVLGPGSMPSGSWLQWCCFLVYFRIRLARSYCIGFTHTAASEGQEPVRCHPPTVPWFVVWSDHARVNSGNIKNSGTTGAVDVSIRAVSSRNAFVFGFGMGSCSASSALLKAWVSWLKGSLILRLIGLPAALLLVHLEIFGSSPVTTSLILHRLSRRLRLSSIACMLSKDDESGMSSIFFVGGADVMDRAQSQRRPNLLPTLDDKDRNRPSGGLPSPHLEESQPRQHSAASSTSSTASTLSHPSPPSSAMSSHARSMSHADIVRQGKRLSLQFPIQPAPGSNSPMFSPRSRPQSWVAAPSPIPSPDAASTPEPNILAVVAAQERFVLELKEELAKAEEDLKMLKKHYATQEAVKQRNELRKVTQLQPLNTTLANITPSQDDEDGSTLWMQREMERRKSLLSGTKTSQRKVFSGSRHLRTLSLLSPDKAYSPSFPQPLDISNSEPPSATMRPPPLSRASTTSGDIANQIATNVNGEKYDLGGLSNIQRDALLRTGKQMATDFKDGLLTFIEDIRQATVGEDMAENGAGPSARGPATKGARKPSDGRPTLQRATSSKKSATAKTGDIGDDFWRQHGLSEPKTSPTNKKTHALKHTRTPQKQIPKTTDEDEDWDNWDTPNDKHTQGSPHGEAEHSSDESEEPSSPASRQASSRTSTRYHSQRHDSKASSLTASSSAGLPDDAVLRDAKRNSIPWPDLVKLSPTNLKRTASHLMKEWEKNLTPPPESRGASHASGDYIGRSVSPGS
ncbi:hypothetical protein K458DRAFT_403576 [Lentithecium fluviatile CBS 122367]|uniref:DUF4048 domain-containing protein n=1 Tax=Lentithecium fluviatile CBS 122367 TaxID=1168545 RepID=A0A6G1J563_9PLEO|nr:hypothetical protein K458DRAFT_403576 [Lentithecium fluviatile CBS 122367]